MDQSVPVHDDRGNREEQLRFETLLTDLSARFINSPVERVDRVFEYALCSVCESLEFDLSALWQWEVTTPGMFGLTHYYRCVEGPPINMQMRASEYFPWSLREVQAGRSFVIASLEAGPEDATIDVQSFRELGVKTIAAFPLSAGGGVPFGAVTFHTMVVEREWPASLIRRLGLIAEIFANALMRKRAEQALRASEERYRGIYEGAIEGIFRTTPEGRILLANPALAAMLGYASAEEMMRAVESTQRQVWAIPEERDRFLGKMDKEGTVRGHECQFLRKDRTRIWVSLSSRLVCGPGGRVSYVEGFVEDIRKRRDLDDALRASEAKFRLLFDASPDGIVLIGADQRIHAVNLAQSRMYRYDSPEEMVGISPTILIVDEDRAFSADIMRRRLGGEVIPAVEYRLRRKDGTEFYGETLAAILRHEDGSIMGYLCVTRDTTLRKEAEEKVRQSLEEVRRLRDQLQNENVYLRQQVLMETGPGAIVGESGPVARMLAMARKVAPTDSAVLITGETGTGKELLAQAIHDLSSRRAKLMVKVNCAALPAPLIESELFGREKGAYTGAMTQQVGRFELADGSTILLDEIGDLPLDLQGKLLRVLQDGHFERLGGRRNLKTDARVIAATNRNLPALVREGKFREDLFHRLNVFPIEVPPLRARTPDIPLLVWTFIQEFNTKMGRAVDAVPKPALEALKQYPWPGNIRELRNVIERAMIVNEGKTLHIDLPEGSLETASKPTRLEDVERHHILETLVRTHWKISGKGGAAEVLGLKPTTLQSRLKKLSIFRPSV